MAALSASSTTSHVETFFRLASSHAFDHVEADTDLKATALLCHQFGTVLLDAVLRGHISPHDSNRFVN